MRLTRAIATLLVAATVFLTCHGEPHETIEVEVTSSGDVDGDVPLPLEDVPPPTPVSTDRHVNAHSGIKKEDRSRLDKFAALQRELEVIETMIDLQQRKMRTLEKVRQELSSEVESEAVAANPRGRRTTAADMESEIERRLSMVTMSAAEGAARARFDSYFVERSEVVLPDDVVDVKLGSVNAPASTEVIVVARRGGELLVFLGSEFDPARIDTGVTDLQGIEVDTLSQPPLITVFGRDIRTPARVLAVNVSPSDAVNPGHRLDVKELFQVPPRGGVQAITLARSGRRSVISVGHGDGSLTFHAVNGTILTETSTNSKGLTSLSTVGQVFAFSDASNAVVFRMTRQKAPEFVVCQGSLGTITSVVLSLHTPDLLFASTTGGEVLAFVLSGVTDAAMQGSSCRLVHRSVIKRGEHLDIVVLKGYVVTSSATGVVVFNVTRSPTDGMLSFMRVEAKPVEDGTSLVKVAATEASHGTFLSLLLENASGQRSLTVLQSLLPSNTNSSDPWMPWQGLPYVVMVVIALVTAQFFLRKNGSDKDLGVDGEDTLRKLMEMHNRGGSTTRPMPRGGMSARSAAFQPTPAAQEYMGDQAMLGATVDAFKRDSKRRQDREHNAEYQKAVEQARRETLECSFDEDDEY